MTEENANSCQLKTEAENTYSCRQCHYVFKLSVGDISVKDGKASCPKCGSDSVNALPAWEPLGANLSETTYMWEYECQQCRHTFKMPVPTSPSQEKEITCPACGNKQVHRLTVIDGAPLYCG
jgi:putative FmdB family regulatory protein